MYQSEFLGVTNVLRLHKMLTLDGADRMRDIQGGSVSIKLFHNVKFILLYLFIV